MRFKYFYQQMLSHLGIITIAFIIVSLIVSQFAESLIFKNKEEELIAYGETIIEELEVLPSVNMNIFEKYQKVLASRNIYVTYLMKRGGFNTRKKITIPRFCFRKMNGIS